MTSATQGYKRAAELTVGDAVIFLDEPYPISSIQAASGGQIMVLLASKRIGGASVIPLLYDPSDDVPIEEATPGPFDGYMSEICGGAWHVTSMGTDIGTFIDESVAATALAATSKRPRWKVTLDGTVTRLG